jgi:hypothetical protein
MLPEYLAGLLLCLPAIRPAAPRLGEDVALCAHTGLGQSHDERKKAAGLPRGETAGTASAFEPAGGNRFERGSTLWQMANRFPEISHPPQMLL